MENEILEHHGIKGQKWGVRRFQNRDGTLTAAGKRRQIADGRLRGDSEKEKHGLSDKQKTLIKAGAAAAVTALAAYGAYKLGKSGKINGLIKRGQETVGKVIEAAKNKKVSKTDLSSMSDADLKAKVSRMALEQQYKKLSTPNVSKGKQVTDKLLKTAGGIAGATSTGLTIYNNVKRIEKIMEDEKKSKKNMTRQE